MILIADPWDFISFFIRITMLQIDLNKQTIELPNSRKPGRTGKDNRQI